MDRARLRCENSQYLDILALSRFAGRALQHLKLRAYLLSETIEKRPDYIVFSTDLMILDGDFKSTLGIVRSIGRQGICMVVGSRHRLGRAGFSKNVQHRFVYRLQNDSIETAHKDILAAVKHYRPRVLMPVYDTTWFVIYRYYRVYQNLTTIVANPGEKLFKDLLDKGRLFAVAKKHGVKMPATFLPQTFKDARSLRNSLPYPVILKPQSGSGGEGMTIAENAGEFESALQFFKEIFVVQEKIEGEDLELTILCDHGKAIAGSAYVSLRNAPLPFGPPVACRTITDDNLMQIGVRFLEGLGYHGVAHLDFRRDQRDSNPLLLDFNARLAGTNDTSLHSGIDFASMLFRMAIKQHVSPCFHYQIGREFRMLFPGELRHLAQTHHKLRTIRELLKLRGVTTELSFKDPLPHLALLLEALVRTGTRKKRTTDG